MKHSEETETLKKQLGEYVVDTFVRDGMRMGLGSGTTAIYAVRRIAELYRQKKLKSIYCCSTGDGTRIEAAELGLPCFYMDSPFLTELDIVIDGADEYDVNGHILKGRGGCLLYEKLAAYSAEQCIYIVTKTKRVENLARKALLPVEFVPPARTRVRQALQNLLPIKIITLRRDANNTGPWVTEEGNYIFDMLLSDNVDPDCTETAINSITGVVENGFFTKRNFTIVSVTKSGSIETEI